jgi:hypothetical protein
MSLNSFLVISGVMMYAAAWRRACNVSRLPRVIIFSATGRVAFARVSVVVMRPCSKRLVTRLRSVARRCHGLRPRFDPDFRCRMLYPLKKFSVFSSKFSVKQIQTNLKTETHVYDG